MFTDETLNFLTELSANNTRDWFKANKSRYDAEVKQAADAFVNEVVAGLAAWTGRSHRGKLFRIHRDLRFSKDKTPYNTHVHLSFVPEDGLGAAAWLVGLSPSYFTLGCGNFAFAKPMLERFRERVAGPGGEAAAACVEGLASGGVRFDPPELKRVPPPWPADHPRGDLLRRKGLVGWIDGPPGSGLGPGAFGYTMAGFNRLRPLFDLLDQT